MTQLTLWIGSLLRLFVFIVLVFFQNKVWAETQEKKIIIKIGESIQIPYKKQVVSPRQKIIKIKTFKNQVLVESHRAGWAALRVDGLDYEISVINRAQHSTEQRLSTEFKYSLEARVKVEKGEVILLGNLMSLDLLERVWKLCTQESCHFQNHLKVPEFLKSKLIEWLDEKNRQIGLSMGQLNFLPHWTLLYGTQSGKKENSETFFSKLGIKVETESKILNIKPLIKAQLLIAEVQKKSAEQFGVKWPTQISAQLLPQVEWGEQMLLSGDFFEQKGWGKTLASPTLVARSGAAAHFWAGGELPIKSGGQYHSQVIWKPFGIKVTLHPEADYSGRMSIKIECEISQIDGSLTVEGIPGIKTNKLETHFDLVQSRIVVLSGLIHSNHSKSYEGLKALSELPILGSIFKSQNFRDQKSELIIFIKPFIEKN